MPTILNPWVLLGAASALALTAAVSFGAGHHAKTLAVAAEQLQIANATTKAVARSAAITSTGDQKTQTAQATTAANTLTNLQKVPAYVPRKADAQCVVGVGAVRLLDAAGRDAPVSDAPGQLPDAPSNVALSDIVSADVVNAGAFHQLVERVKGWEDWYAEQSAAWTAHPPDPG